MPPSTAEPIAGAKDNWMRTFFPGVIEPAQARQLSVNSGEIRGIDITFQTAPIPTFKISGIAVNPRPNPATEDRSFNSFVLMTRESSAVDGTAALVFQNMIPAANRRNGEFEIRNVRPGIYDLFPVSSVPGLLAGRTFVNVRNSDLEGIRVAVNPAVNLEGTVVIHNVQAPTIPLDSIKIRLRGRSLPPMATANSTADFPVDASGKFTAVGLAGEEAVIEVLGLPESAYVADIRQGDVSVYDSGLQVTASPEPLRVTIEARGSTVEGIVRNQQRQPDSRVTVVLLPAAERRQNAALYKTRITNESGRFEIRGIPPGTYTVLAWKSVTPTAWQNAEFLSSFVDRGQVIEVTPASHSNLDLESIP
jgi:hypothetical protein